MSASRQPIRYQPEFDLDFVERLLGRQGETPLPRATRQRLTVQQNRLREILSPRVTWKSYSIADRDKAGIQLENGIVLESRKMAYSLRKADSVIVFIATVGRLIDNEIESLIETGAIADGYIADALGSGAVESLANRFHDDMAGEAARRNQSVGLRFSPGYCDWPVTEQHKLFSLIDHNVVGVELADTSLMTPRKSISGVFGVFAGNDSEQAGRTANPCRRCGKLDCIARRADAVPPS